MKVELKPHIRRDDIWELSPWLIEVYGAFLAYAAIHGLPVIITSIKDDAKGRVSDTHSTGRGLDISSRGWTEFYIHQVVFHLNKKFGPEYGTAPAGHEPKRVIIHHDSGSGDHFHCQVRRMPNDGPDNRSVA